MLLTCVYREEINAPILIGKYDTETGLIEGVDPNVFKRTFARADVDEYSESFKANPFLAIDSYFEQLQLESMLVAINYYNIGFILMDRRTCFIKCLKTTEILKRIPRNVDDVVFDYEIKVVGFNYTELPNITTNIGMTFAFYNARDNTIFTSDGILHVADRLRVILNVGSPGDGKKYVKMVRGGYTCLLNTTEGMKMCVIDRDGKLNFEEVD